MVSKLVILVAIVLVVQGKSLEENTSTNDVELTNEENIFNGENERKVPSITGIAAIQSDKINYEKLKPEIEKYHEKVEKTYFGIYPGTKWCGTGNIAWGYNDLGLFRYVDMCCRNHDYCPDYITPSATKYGLTNTGPITKLQCSCDTQFYNCLKGIGSLPARDVGQIYFNSIGSQCFKEDYPIVKCTANYTTSYYIARCKDYQLDTNAAKKYQFFDVPIY